MKNPATFIWERELFKLEISFTKCYSKLSIFRYLHIIMYCRWWIIQSWACENTVATTWPCFPHTKLLLVIALCIFYLWLTQFRHRDLKGIVSRDSGELQMIPVDSLEVFSIAGSYLYSFLTTFSCLNLLKRRDCGTAFGYHFSYEKWYSQRFSIPADYHYLNEELPWYTTLF